MKKMISFLLALACVLSLSGCKWIFDSQYNENGISHFLSITIDENQPREFIGDLGDHSIYVEKLKLGELYFTTINAENILLSEAIEKELVSIDDWRKHAWDIVNVESTEILRYENYEIAINNGDCIIRPITKCQTALRFNGAFLILFPLNIVL